MNKKNAVIVMLLVAFIITFTSFIILDVDGKEDLKGNINILVKDDTYDYVISEAKKFEDANKKVNINVFLNKNIDNVSEYIKENNIDMVQGNSIEYSKINKHLINKNTSNNIINTYKKNFSESRLMESKEDGQYVSVPFTSNPLALFVRIDIISQYGYNESDIATWQDLINIGVDIFNKTKGEVRIFNKKDWQNICNLIILQYMGELNGNEDKYFAAKERLSFLLDKQLIGFYGEDNYLARITSVNFVEEEKNNTWKCVNVPSINPGGNRFYDIGGDSLIVVTNDKSKEEIISKFIGYITSNIEQLTDEMIEGKFFTSSILSYKSKKIETKVNNIKGESPFVILTNISEKALPISNFDEYLDQLKEILTKWVI